MEASGQKPHERPLDRNRESKPAPWMSRRESSIGTPRTSFDAYSPSNHSSDTMTSDYPNALAAAFRFTADQESFNSQSPQATMKSIEPIALMIGYVQLIGSFTLDESLVNSSMFEKAKRQSVIGGQAGGGVVGVDHTRRSDGLLSSLGWPKFGQSIGSLLTGTDASSFRGMRGIANAKAVPIISTPQSILFVDLTLQPGECKSFVYSHKLPLGTPPTFRGRTLKAEYQLLVGVQRHQTSAQQPHTQHVEAPFRVLPAVFGQCLLA